MRLSFEQHFFFYLLFSTGFRGGHPVLFSKWRGEQIQTKALKYVCLPFMLLNLLPPTLLLCVTRLPCTSPHPVCPPLLQVQSEIKRKWRRWMLQRFLGTDAKYQQPSMGSNGNNSSTQITMLTKCSPTTRRASIYQEHLSVI